MKKKIIGLTGILLGIAIAFIPPIDGLDKNAMIVLGTVVTANIFWIFSIIPNFATGLIMVASWPLFKTVKFAEAFSVFSGSGWWIVVGGLGIGAVATKTGLMKRVALYVMRMFPVNFKGQTLAMIFAGTVVAPTIPSTNAKGAIAAPLAKSISDTLGYQEKSKPSAGLFAAMFWGFIVSAPLFLSATSTNYVIKGLLPEQLQNQLSWGYWFLIAIPWAIIVLVGGYVLINVFYKPKQDGKIEKVNIEQQIAALGKMGRDEKITAIVLCITLVFWILEQTLNVSSSIVAIIALSVLLGLKVVSPVEFRTKIPWDAAIFIGCAMSLGTVLGVVGVSHWLEVTLGTIITPILSNPIVAILALSLIIYAAKFALVSLITAATVFLLVLMPFFSALSYSPVILVFIVTTSINVWILPYMNPPYLTTEAAVDGKMSTDKYAMTSSLIYMVLNIVGLLISLPYWHFLGLY